MLNLIIYSQLQNLGFKTYHQLGYLAQKDVAIFFAQTPDLAMSLINADAKVVAICGQRNLWLELNIKTRLGDGVNILYANEQNCLFDYNNNQKISIYDVYDVFYKTATPRFDKQAIEYQSTAIKTLNKLGIPMLTYGQIVVKKVFCRMLAWGHSVLNKDQIRLAIEDCNFNVDLAYAKFKETVDLWIKNTAMLKPNLKIDTKNFTTTKFLKFLHKNFVEELV